MESISKSKPVVKGYSGGAYVEFWESEVEAPLLEYSIECDGKVSKGFFYQSGSPTTQELINKIVSNHLMMYEGVAEDEEYPGLKGWTPRKMREAASRSVKETQARYARMALNPEFANDRLPVTHSPVQYKTPEERLKQFEKGNRL